MSSVSSKNCLSLWHICSHSSKAWRGRRKTLCLPVLRPLAGSGEGDPSRAGVPGSALVYISQTKHMSLQEVEMTLEDTISLVLSLHQLLEVSVSAGFSHLLSSWGGCVWGTLPSGERSPPQSLYSSFSFGVWNFSYWLASLHLWC